MEPARLIEELCRRYRVSPKWGQKLLPLVERARVVPPESGARILDLVERSFAEEARRAREEEATRTETDGRFLRAVAPILHGWTPPEWLSRGTAAEGGGTGGGPEGADDDGAAEGGSATG